MRSERALAELEKERDLAMRSLRAELEEKERKARAELEARLSEERAEAREHLKRTRESLGSQLEAATKKLKVQGEELEGARNATEFARKFAENFSDRFGPPRPKVSECPICSEPMDGDDPFGVAQPCGHMFHLQCAAQWANVRRSNGKSNTCAVCKRKITDMTQAF